MLTQSTMDGLVALAGEERKRRDDKETEAEALREHTQTLEDEMGAMRASTAAREISLGSWRNAIRASPFSESASQQQRASASSAQITVHTPQQ
jgi:hypothetical protein